MRRAAIELALLPGRIAPWGVALLGLLLAGAVALLWTTDAGAAALAGFALWFLWWLAGAALKSIARKETLLLPDFRRALALAAAGWALLFWLLPVLGAGLLSGATAAWMSLGYGALAIAWAVLASSDSRAGIYFWVTIIGARFLPADLWRALQPALTGALLPLAALLLAALLLRLAWLRLFPAGDVPLPDAPMLAPDPLQRGMAQQSNAAPRGKLMRRLNGWSEQAAGTQLRLRAIRYHRAPTAARQRGLLRALLLPHEQLRGWMVRWLLFGGVVLAYTLAVGHDAQVGMVAGYATFFAMTGLNTIGMGMPRLRPSLGELYFTMAPRTHAAFKAQLVDSFLGVLPGAILSAFVYTSIAALLLAPSAWMHVLATTAVLAPPLALATLALYLNLPAERILRTIIQIVTVFGQMGTYWLLYALIERYGPLWGGVPALAITWGFALGAWSAARAHWIAQPLRFDPPDARSGA